MRYVLWLALALAALYGLHRLATWAERRGYIYYLHKRGSSGSLGSAALTVHAMLEPSNRYVLEERQKDESEEEASGDPPEPGGERGGEGSARGEDSR